MGEQAAAGAVGREAVPSTGSRRDDQEQDVRQVVPAHLAIG